MPGRRPLFMRGVRMGDNSATIAVRRRNRRFRKAKNAVDVFLNSAAEDAETRKQCLTTLEKFVSNEAGVEGTPYSVLKGLADTLLIKSKTPQNEATFNEKIAKVREFVERELGKRKALMDDMQRDL